MLDPLAQLGSGLAGRYSIERELGRGGMATVFLARDLRHDRSVAVKVLHPELVAALAPERFHREVEIAASLRHPHIIPLFDSGQVGDLLYYVMAYAEGGSLRGRLRREKQLPLDEALELTRQVASALAFAHSRGVVHRDIKPENILLESDQAVVADFGLAQALTGSHTDRITGSGLALGTPAYMSPEQVTGEREVDGRSDLYSLACVVYEMLAGEPPFTGPTPHAVMARRLAGVVPELRVVRERVPEPVAQAVHRALSKAPADRFASVAQFSAALTQGATSGASVPAYSSVARKKRRVLALASVAALGVVGIVAVGAQLRRSATQPPLDPNLVAVAPFETLGSGVDIWREGVMDLLSRNLDGAGPLRAVGPAIVLRHWGELAPRASAEELGRRTGARLSITGSVVSSGTDSVLLSATVLDVATHEALGEARIAGAMSRLGLSVDSLTMQLLKAIGRTRPIGAVRLATISSASLPALKAYLQGEQYFRRAAWDSALGYFERAADLDPGFALAFHRIFESRGFPTPGLDSLVWTYALKAGALNRGLGARESLLIAADSILGPVAIGSEPDSVAPQSVARSLATLQAAARRFSNDPEVWYQLGKTRSRFGWLIGVDPREALAPLNRSIALDSAFAPAHVEVLQVAMLAQGPEATVRYLDAYLGLQPTGPPADVARLARMLMDPERAGARAAQNILDTASAVLLYQTYTILEWWSDSAETAIRVARQLAARPTDPNLSSDPEVGRKVLLHSLAWRGHLQAAYRLWSGSWLAIFNELAVLGGAPPDTASAVFERLLAGEPWPSPNLVFALPWWGQSGDTLPLKMVIERAGGPRHRGGDEPAVHYLGEAAKAYLALGRRDTTTALQLFLNLSHFVNYGAVGDWERYTAIRLLNSKARYRDALQRLDLETRSSAWPYEVLIAMERGRTLEGLGSSDAAAAAYTEVVKTWANGDPGVQPMVKEARAGLARLRRAA